MGVETIQANSGGTITSDTLSFYVRDEVGSVIATVTENLGGANQTVALTSYDAWGKARATTGSTAYQDLLPGTFYSPTPSGQEEGFAGHDNLSDTGLVDMEGRVYDPEVGTFLSADPNVQYPFSSQGYDRYIYVNDNPLSLSDPSGYFSGMQAVGLAGAIVMSIYGNEEGWAWYETAFASGAVDGYLSSGGNVQAGVESGLEAVAFSYVGDQVTWGTSEGDLLAKSIAEGMIGGAFSEAGGGNFCDGFIGAFTSSELSPVIGNIGGDPNTTPPAVYFSATNMAARAVVSAVVGGTVAAMTGGDFTDGAMAAAFQRLFNEEQARKSFLQKLAESLKDVGSGIQGEGGGQIGLKVSAKVFGVKITSGADWGTGGWATLGGDAGVYQSWEADLFVLKAGPYEFGLGTGEHETKFDFMKSYDDPASVIVTRSSPIIFRAENKAVEYNPFDFSASATVGLFHLGASVDFEKIYEGLKHTWFDQ